MLKTKCLRAFYVASFLFVSLTGPHSSAGEAGRFKTLARVIPAMLQSRYSQFGALNLRQFQAQVSSVRVAIQSEAEIERRNGNGRKSARWEHTPNGPVITYDPYALKRWDVGAIEPLLALHDFMGILGYKDEDYVPSLGMFFLARPTTNRYLTPEERAQIVAVINQRLSQRMAGGGVIGVGGGGQFATLLYRALMMVKCSMMMEMARTPQDRDAVMKALIILWTERDEVTYNGGANPRIDFSLPGR